MNMTATQSEAPMKDSDLKMENEKAWLESKKFFILPVCLVIYQW
jgi:hypothetical protein